jgi:hypothetical protein
VLFIAKAGSTTICGRSLASPVRFCRPAFISPTAGRPDFTPPILVPGTFADYPGRGIAQQSEDATLSPNPVRECYGKGSHDSLRECLTLPNNEEDESNTLFEPHAFADGNWNWGCRGAPGQPPELAAAQSILGRLLNWFGWLRLLWVHRSYTGDAFAIGVNELSRKLAVVVVKRSDSTDGFKVLPRRWVVEQTCG